MDRNRKVAAASAALAIAFALLAAARLVWILWFSNNPANSDYRYVWMAGNFWLHGLDPYGPAFASSRIPGLAEKYSLAVWMYPPHWISVATPLAIPDFQASFALWLVCSSLLFTLSATAVWWALSHQRALLPWWLAFAFTMTPVTGALGTGQPATLAFVGICLLVYGLAQSKARLLLPVGVFLALLKLQLGGPFVLLMLLSRETRRSAIIGSVVALLVSIPSFVIGGSQDGFIGALLHRNSYSAIPYNTPMQMTGIAHVIARVAKVQVPVDVSLVAGAALAAVLYFMSKRGRIETFIIAGICSTVTVVSLHTYDLMLTILLLPLLARLDRWQSIPAVAGFLLLWRPENLARIVGGSDSPVVVADITTVAGLLICLPFIVWLLSPRPEVERGGLQEVAGAIA